MEDRMSIIVYSGTVDKLMAVSTLATGGAAMGLDVELFITSGVWKHSARMPTKPTCASARILKTMPRS